MPFKDTDNSDQSPSNSHYKAYIKEEQSNVRMISRNILVINDSNNDRILQEDAPISVDQFDNVYFYELILYLREQNLIVPDSSIFFFDIERNLFVHQGRESMITNLMIPLKKFSADEIKIKYRPSEQFSKQSNYYGSHNVPHHNPYQSFPSSFHHMQSQSQGSMMLQGDSVFCGRGPTFGSSSMSFSQSPVLNSQNQTQNSLGSSLKEEDDDENQDVSSKAIPREKRVKERKIGYVYDRVQEWRKYYENGVLNVQGRLQKVNLDIAASLVGLSRKTLDDYYKYIRKAEQYQFDFKGRAEEKIGVLRNFVRDRQKRLNKNDLDDDNILTKAEQVEDNMSSTINSEQDQKFQSQSRNYSQLPPPPPYAHEVQQPKPAYSDASASCFNAKQNEIEEIEEEFSNIKNIHLGDLSQEIFKQEPDFQNKIDLDKEQFFNQNNDEEEEQQSSQSEQVKQEFCSNCASPNETQVEEEQEQEEEEEEECDFLNNEKMEKNIEEEY